MTSDRAFIPAASHDIFLPFYDPIARLMGGDRVRRDLTQQANIKSGQRILDIGCGTGTLALQLKKEFADVEVIGLDPDPKALRRAESKAARVGVSVQFDQGFADELPYESNSFDRVLSSLMFHHLDKPTREKTLTEVVRVLKPGGSLHLVDFATTGDGDSHGSHGLHSHVMNLFHSKDRVESISDTRTLELIREGGFKKAEKVKEAKMLLGLLRVAYYQSTV